MAEEKKQKLEIAIFRHELLLLPTAAAITAAVISSAAAKASHTPVIPNSAAITRAQTEIATTPLRMDVTNAQPAFSVALKYPVPIILNPANRNPIK